MRELGADDAVPGPNAACRALAADASLGDAARAAGTTAIAMLREGQTASAYAHARLAGTLERLARGAIGDGAEATDRGRASALDFLRREVAREFGPEAPGPTDD